MNLNIHLCYRASCLILATLLGIVAPAASQAACPASADTALRAGWRAYRSDSLMRAVQSFERAHRLCPINLDAQIGLGFARFRLGEPKPAAVPFDNVLAPDSTNSDAWEGKTRARLRLGDTVGALAAGRKAIELVPDNSDLRSML